MNCHKRPAENDRTEWRFAMSDWQCGCGHTNYPSSNHRCYACGAIQQNETLKTYFRKMGSNDEWQEYVAQD